MRKLSRIQQDSSNIETPSKICYNEYCKDCFAWRILDGPQPASDELIGACHLKPPICTQDENGEPLFMWPIVTSRDWCAKFKKSRETSEREKLSKSGV